MEKSTLFQYAILWHPTTKQAEDEGLKSKILVEPGVILSSSQSSAAIAASMDVPSEYKNQVDQIEVLVRPF